MKIAFYSNYLLHHQTPFCNEMYKLLQKDFTFIATKRIPHSRLDLGYKDLSKSYPYCLNVYESEENQKKAYELSLESDIVILGSAPDLYLRDRVLKGKITFRYSERYFKEGKWRIIDPRVALARYRADFRYRKYQNLYMLCAGAYAASDCRFIFSYPDRTYKWGYFTSIKEHNIEELMQKKRNEHIKILWVARFIKLKHPEKPIEVTRKLLNEGFRVQLDIIGIGPMENYMKELVNNYQLSEEVTFLGSMPPEKVIEHMEKANIFLFTSNRQEGWGAVINESMSSGCAVVANKVIGSVPFLIKDEENGLIYNNTTASLYNQVKRLVMDKQMCERLGVNAYKTMKYEWRPEMAAKRLIEFCEGIMNRNIIKFETGPLSKAR